MSFEYSNAPAKLLKEIDEFSGGSLKKRVDLQIIFEESLNRNNSRLLDELAFTSKYVAGLLRVLKEGSKNSEVDNLDQVKKDLSLNMNKTITKIREILNDADGNTKQYFERTYFEMSQQSFFNLNELISDLEWTKKYLNVQKRKIKN